MVFIVVHAVKPLSRVHVRDNIVVLRLSSSQRLICIGP